jgi:hypothetical protein
VILVDRQAQVIPVTLGTGTVKVEAPPAAFALKFNRPNPFNPSTTIGYEVAQATRVTLAVYNLLGQEVVRLVDAFRTPGRYEATWDGRNARGQAVSSGVYIYRMTTNTGFVETKRLTLLK